MFEQPDPKQRQRLLWAIGLAAVILVVSDFASMYLTGNHVLGGLSPRPAATAEAVGAAPAAAGVAVPAVAPASVAAALRLPLENERVAAQVNTLGGRLDMVTLKKYADKQGEPAGYDLLKPEGPNMGYVQAGWLGSGLKGPDAGAVWQAEGDINGPGKPVVLVWRNDSGQVFQRQVALRPDSYVIEVTDRVFNSAQLPVTFTHYAQVQAADGYLPHEKSNWVNYYGPMGWMQQGEDHRLVEDSYSDVKKAGKSETLTGTGGWWGITSQYFMAAVVPQNAASTQRDFRHAVVGGRDFYTATVQQPQLVVPPNGQAEVTYLVYAGPKSYYQLKHVGENLEQAIAWGWFEPLVKGMYAVLHWLHGFLGNWGLAIIALTLLLKIITFPLANKSYHAMAKMKKLQPKIEALKKQYGDNQQEMGTRMMQLYQQEKVNPLGGCWPMLIQIPIFFAMYKVVLVTFEFRHAPLGLWIHDMSAMDPYYVLPLLMGASMFIQMRMQPPAADPTQAAVFKWMPVMFTAMFLFFPSGLVLYWLVNNVLSIIQQYIIMKQDRAI